MEYRYEETVSWVIPGLYLLFAILGVLWLMDIFNPCSIFSGSENDKIPSEFIGTFVLFLIPVSAFIIGWCLDAIAGYVLRLDRLFHYPITRAYRKISRIVNEEEAVTDVHYRDIIKKFDNAKYKIDLKEVDRFYYRYVASRNMFVAQLIVTVMIIDLVIYKGLSIELSLLPNSLLLSGLLYCYVACLNMLVAPLIIYITVTVLPICNCLSIELALLFCSLFLSALFYLVMDRDLHTHARYVFYEEMHPKK